MKPIYEIVCVDDIKRRGDSPLSSFEKVGVASKNGDGSFLLEFSKPPTGRFLMQFIDKGDYVCEECGSTEVSYDAWVEYNTGEVPKDSEGPLNKSWCNGCEAHTNVLYKEPS